VVTRVVADEWRRISKTLRWRQCAEQSSRLSQFTVPPPLTLPVRYHVRYHYYHWLPQSQCARVWRPTLNSTLDYYIIESWTALTVTTHTSEVTSRRSASWRVVIASFIIIVVGFLRYVRCTSSVFPSFYLLIFGESNIILLFGHIPISY